ncbi:LPXTG cell wall anchor domain-containing protein, partial [Streptococcus castoreus]|uniref:LPXTG cell wall anchor domain-containing protein n=1 Tax=Streptococcus castoreus TaxID=254786 RepID=UPI0004828B71
VDVTVKVVDPRTDADKNDPKVTPMLSNTGKTAISEAKKLPATGDNGSQFFNVAALAIIASIGLLSTGKKKED